jgi:hypothetical protein
MSKEKFWREYPCILAVVDEYCEKYPKITGRFEYINLYALALAVRRQEDGPKGTEFGILHPSARNTNLEEQTRWAVGTFIRNLERWERALRDGSWKKTNLSLELDYIAFLGSRWAPVGAANDPLGSNKYWTTNVQKLYMLYRR